MFELISSHVRLDLHVVNKLRDLPRGELTLISIAHVILDKESMAGSKKSALPWGLKEDKLKPNSVDVINAVLLYVRFNLFFN